MRPSQAEVAALLAADKVLSANIRWRAAGHERYRLEAKVLVPSTGVLLALTGNKGKRNFSFVLLYANHAICKATKHHKHHNPTCEHITGMHVHTWDEFHEDGIASNIGGLEADDINNVFLQFLGLCNIRLVGTYKPFLI